MAVRSTMSAIIAKVRQLIGDPASATAQFDDQWIQDVLDARRDDVRYEQLQPGPSIVNAASTNNQPAVIWADYYSRYPFWESDVVLQGLNVSTGAAYIVLAPLASDLVTGRWQFELTPFVNGTAPGQWPPVFATGKVYDVYGASADLLEQWAATWTRKYSFSADGASFQRNQAFQSLLKLADQYRAKAKPTSGTLVRSDIAEDANPDGADDALSVHASWVRWGS